MTAPPPQQPAMRVRRLVGLGVAGQLSFVASQLIMLLALSRLSTVEEVGRYGLASAIATPIFFMFSFGFLANQATDVDNRHSFREFKRLRTLSSAASLLIVAVVAAFLKDAATRYTVLAFAASRSIDNRSVLIYGLLQKYERMERVAISLLLRGAGGSVMFALVLWQTRSCALALLGLAAAWFAVAALHDSPLAEKLVRGTPDDRPATAAGMRAIVKKAWPNGLNAMLGGAQTSIPRFIITSLMGLEALGRFTLVSYVLQVVNTLFSAVSQSLLARMAMFRRNGQTGAFFGVMYRLIAIVIALTAGAAVIAAVIGGPALRIVLGPDYGGLGLLLVLSLVTAGCSAVVMLLQGSMMSAHRFMGNLKVRILVVALVAPACFIGIKLAGVEGVMAAMGATFAIQALLLLFLLRRERGLPGAASPQGGTGDPA